MISKDVKSRLLSGVLQLIPEYERLKELSNTIKTKYIDYLENTYLTEKDKEFKSYWVTSDEIYIISSEHIYINYELVSLNYNLWKDTRNLYKLQLEKEVPYISESLVDIKEIDLKFWEYLKNDVQNYIKTAKSFSKKLNKFLEIIGDNTLILTTIKTNFPELYEKYRSI